MTGHANGRPRPRPGLGGTGRVADELYLIGHHEVTGRVHLSPRAAGLGLAGALLAELVLADAIIVDAGSVVPAGPGRADDGLTAAIGGQIAGTGHVVAAAAAQGPGLMFGLSGNSVLAQAAQWLFLTSLFAAALAFHNATWRYIYALGRENVLPAEFGRTSGNNVPRAASLAQSATGLAVIGLYAATHQNPMTRLFFWAGTTGGLGVMILLAATSVAVVVFFARDARGENAWRRLVAPALAAVLLAGIVVLAVQHYALLLGVPAGSPAAWALPAGYAAVAIIGLGWGLILKLTRPQVYAAIGLGAHAVTAQPAPSARHPGDRQST